VNACTSDAVIAVSGGYGTLSEIALALKLGKPVVLLRSWSFEADGPLAPVARAETAEEAVDVALRAARERAR
jgi:predicted Rossmann-fold nucleotide-binding protein